MQVQVEVEAEAVLQFVLQQKPRLQQVCPQTCPLCSSSGRTPPPASALSNTSEVYADLSSRSGPDSARRTKTDSMMTTTCFDVSGRAFVLASPFGRDPGSSCRTGAPGSDESSGPARRVPGPRRWPAGHPAFAFASPPLRASA